MLAFHQVILESEPDERMVAVGMDSTGRILVVVYTLRGEDIRLISARGGTPHEGDRI